MRSPAAPAFALVALVTLAARADDAEVPASPALERVRAAATEEGSVAERAARVRALGPEAVAMLLSEKSLAGAADELMGPVLEGLPDDDLKRMALGWLVGEGRLFDLALPRIPKPPRDAFAEPLLRYIARGSEGGAKAAAALALFDDILDRRGVAPLGRLPEDRSEPAVLRVVLVSALARNGRPEAIAPLLDLTEDPQPEVRIAAAAALGEIDDGSDRQLPALLRLLAEKDPTGKKCAAVALGRLRASGAVERLTAALETDDPGVRGDVHWALREITGQSLPPEAEPWRTYWLAERERADRDLPILLLELRSADPPIVVAAMRDLAGFPAGRGKIRAALRPLIASGSDMGVRTAAFALLAQLQDRSAVPALVGALDEKDPEIWEAAWNALKRITGKNLPPSAAAWKRRR